MVFDGKWQQYFKRRDEKRRIETNKLKSMLRYNNCCKPLVSFSTQDSTKMFVVISKPFHIKPHSFEKSLDKKNREKLHA